MQVAAVDDAAGPDGRFRRLAGESWDSCKARITILVSDWKAMTLEEQMLILEVYGYQRLAVRRLLATQINKLLGIGEWGQSWSCCVLWMDQVCRV